jgi:hypothetical protein
MARYKNTFRRKDRRKKKTKAKAEDKPFLFHKAKGAAAGEAQMKGSYGKKGQKGKAVGAGGKGCKPPHCKRVIDKAGGDNA